MHIRIATDEDLQSLTPLFDEYRKSLGQDSRLAACKEFIEYRLQENDSVIFIAFLVDVPVGFIQLYPSFSSLLLKSLWYFDDLFVAEPYRKRGIGTELVKKAKELADETQVLAVRREKIEGDGFLPIDTLALFESKL
ncbi:GNAT family N-acetyltransferase [Shewanella psychropiezotolerans]|uniref:GNAT family N-acetyltransferase n=1 Tax=Shewanella psychropiezotolerans TaxID=2593655 RepID=A0ABX5WXI7_9GAMM|nr:MULTISPECIES: GNAT family N-acetyltransferase [Shewanella]MPY26562.1 GNAT family N-acetyltransferase [Shewanella sp. YLB-07]QDO83775.1 GNAT family N-acetyltransferase [Shewanella psychropiezotolerans]